ncbi:MAG: mechanosensitive ion channel family protein [Chitinophagales bacterium]|jgi:MscS family membrane protein|nr:mechanosensitive ion channel family protein [Chitinophagales bacterium]
MNIFHQQFYHNTIQQWFTAAAILLASVLLARGIYWLVSLILRRFTKQTESELDDLIIARIDAPVALGIVLIGFRLAIEQLTLSRPIENYLQRAFVLMSALTITWLLTRVVRASIEYYFKQYWDRENATVDEQMMMLGKRVSVVVLWSLGAIVGLNNAGFDVGALIAGLGIGGLALALAAQDTVKNIIGGMVIFIDKPFRFGDFVKIKEVEGMVVYVGIRSTRIRNGAGRLVTIPNSQFTDSQIENISSEPSRRVVSYLQLEQDSSAEKIEVAVKILRDIVTESPNVNEKDCLIFFEKFNASSLDINFTYYIKAGRDFQAVQTEINLEVVRRFRQAEIMLAYPTQTVIKK